MIEWYFVIFKINYLCLFLMITFFIDYNSHNKIKYHLSYYKGEFDNFMIAFIGSIKKNFIIKKYQDGDSNPDIRV